MAAGAASEPGGHDTLVGIEGLTGSRFDDQLLGDDGENFFVAGDGDDRIDGREAVDTVYYFSSTAPNGIGLTFDTGPVSVNLATGTAWNFSDVNQTNGDSLAGIEDVVGSAKGDTLIGDSGSNLLMGDSGDDRMFGGPGADAFAGDAGNDHMFGGPGEDFTQYVFQPPIRAHLASGSIAVAGTGQSRRRTYPEHDRIRGMEIVEGSRANDTLIGGPRRDFLLGGGGRDRLLGRGNQDTLKGGRGKDRLLDGGPGRDHCLDPRRRACESTQLPKNLRDELRHAIAELQGDIFRHRGRRVQR